MNVFRDLVIFAGGIAIGAFVTNKLLKTKYEEIVQEEIASLKEVANRHLEKEQEDVVSEMDEAAYVAHCAAVTAQNSQDEVTVYDSDGNVAQTIKYKKRERKPINYEALSRKKKPTEDEEDEAFIAKMSGIAQHINKEEPYVISESEFSEERIEFDKLTIHYYEEDDTLVDEREEIISDTDAIVGDEALLCFGEDSNDPDTIFVRNEKLAIDYEVLRLHKSYQKDVLGIVDKPKKRRKALNEDE